MEYTPLMNLYLHAPLIFPKIDGLPSEFHENEEILLCYDLNPAQSRSIEPDRGLLPGSLVFAGRKTGDCPLQDSPLQEGIVRLPPGNYLFTQRRGGQISPLNTDEWLDMAVEQQKDGLWERYKPENRLFVRFLFEDGSPVTQLFRALPGVGL
jgi:hypothetical protein